MFILLRHEQNVIYSKLVNNPFNEHLLIFGTFLCVLSKYLTDDSWFNSNIIFKEALTRPPDILVLFKPFQFWLHIHISAICTSLILQKKIIKWIDQICGNSQVFDLNVKRPSFKKVILGLHVNLIPPTPPYPL